MWLRVYAGMPGAMGSAKRMSAPVVQSKEERARWMAVFADVLGVG